MLYTEEIISNQSEFTLFELIITIIVIAILTSIGLLAYQRYVKRRL